MVDLNKNGEDDIQEIVDGVTSFIAAEGVLLKTAVVNAGAWLVKEIEGIPDAVQSVLQGAVVEAKGDGNKPLGEVVADTLTILYNDAHALFEGAEQSVMDGAKAIKSSVVEAVVGLTTQTPTA